MPKPVRIKESLPEKLIRCRHLLKHFVLYKLLSREWMQATRRSKNSYLNQSCFIFATGPSVQNIDLDLVRDHIRNKGFKVFGVNSYVNTELFDTIPTDFVVISDPVYLGTKENPNSPYQEEYLQDIQRIEAKKGLKLFLPHHWQKPVRERGLYKKNECFYFNHAENFHGRINGCNILKPRYYLAMTAYIAICIAVYLGFKEIYLFGFDEDRIKEIELDIDNNLFWRDRHYYPETEERVTRNMTQQVGLGLEEYCKGVIQSCESQKKIQADAASQGVRIMNCNPSSFVVGFPKGTAFLKRAQRADHG